jgi:ABC-type bacteriocin/lantibiotic exporter with double-glycine peptidase domain
VSSLTNALASGRDGASRSAVVTEIDVFFSPVQQRPQVFDFWQQTRVWVARISELPGACLREISERGRSLSAGQRQLSAVARAGLVDPAVLLLDEATSQLDLATEARVTAAM